MRNDINHVLSSLRKERVCSNQQHLSIICVFLSNFYCLIKLLSSYRSFFVLSFFCRLINLLSSYQYFLVLLNFCYLLFTLSINHINMYPLYTAHTTLALLSKYLLLLLQNKLPHPSTGLLIWLIFETSVYSSGTVESYRSLRFLNTLCSWPGRERCNNVKL